MAIYNLFRGGFDFGGRKKCKDCEQCLDEYGVPSVLQPDHRDGYLWRDSREWQSLMKTLETRYGVSVQDLEVGDELLIFGLPNYSTMKSLFIDFRVPVSGFGFELKLLDEVLDEKEVIIANYEHCKGVSNTDRSKSVADLTNFSKMDEQTSVLMKYDFTTMKSNAIVLKITSLPKEPQALGGAEILFARRYEQDGYFM